MRFFLYLLCLAALCNCNYSSKSTINSKIDSLISAKSETPFNGIILISQNGIATYAKTQGYADFENKKLIQENSQFIIGSISKQFTAVIVLRELDKGHLSLNDPISKYLPELKQPWADSVTIYHLVLHMHGIEALDKPLAFRPGSAFDYNLANTGYNLLSKIVEHTSGKSFADLSAELFKICNMKDTYHPEIKNYTNLVNGYTEETKGKLQFDSNSFQNAPAAGCFISTAADLIKWNENLHNGKLLKPETYKMMISKQKNAVRNHHVFGKTEYGYGLTASTQDSLVQLGQTGFAPGFASMNFYFPESKTSVIVLENAAYNMNDLKKTFYFHTQILKIVRGNLILSR